MKLTENFNLKEFNCKDGTKVPKEYIKNVVNLAYNLQTVRNFFTALYEEVFEVSIIMNSGYRTQEYNEDIGGSKGSKHLTAEAGDFIVMLKDLREDKEPIQLNPTIVYNALFFLMEAKAIDFGGLGHYDTFTHYDIRGTFVTWDNRS